MPSLIKHPSIYSFNPKNIVSNEEIFAKKTKKLLSNGLEVDVKPFAKDGLFSEEIFGSFETEDEYSCSPFCKKYTGKFNKGIICDSCGEEVVFRESNMDKYGWIDLSGNKYNDQGNITEYGKQWKIISYTAYIFLEKVIGVANMQNIIHVSEKTTIEGDLDLEWIENVRNEKTNQKYWYVGLRGFEENYHEILEYYFKLNKEKDPELFKWLQDKSEIFTDKILVPSTMLRPAMRTADSFKLDKINILYINLIKNNSMLNSKIDQLALFENSTLERIQAEFFQLSELILNNLIGKFGHLRYQINGSRLNYVARNIITPGDKDLPSDSVSMPYLDFLILHKQEMINIISRIKNISLKEAELIHFYATLNFDEEVYSIMEKIIKEEEVSILLNRNPTIALGSILYIKIHEVKKDINDFTLSLSNSILSLLNADFDGDVLNIISLKDEEMKRVFEKTFSPTSLLIDSNNGRINEKLLPERDQLLAINSLLSDTITIE